MWGCCKRLAELLEAPHIRFLSSGTHGMVFPWVLPAIGIPVGVGQRLEEELQTHLEHVIDSLVGASTSQSRTSSPVRLDPGDGIEFSDEFEALGEDYLSELEVKLVIRGILPSTKESQLILCV